VPSRSARRLLDRFALAKALHVTVATVDRWVDEGLPVARPGVRGRMKTLIDVAVARAWRRTTKTGNNDPATMRLLTANRGLVAAEIERLKVERLPAASAAWLREQLVAGFTQLTQGWPARAAEAIAPALDEGLKDWPLAFRVRVTVIRELLERLAADPAPVVTPPVQSARVPATSRDAKVAFVTARSELAELRLAVRAGEWPRIVDVRHEAEDRAVNARQVLWNILIGHIATVHNPDAAKLRALFETAIADAAAALKGPAHADDEKPSKPRRNAPPRPAPPRAGATVHRSRRVAAPAAGDSPAGAAVPRGHAKTRQARAKGAGRVMAAQGDRP
jgi:hypothetical protein